MTFLLRQISTTLEVFSLTSYANTTEYDTQVLVLLRRMTSLKDLTLRLSISNRWTFVDGIDLQTTVLCHLPQVERFVFNITTSTGATKNINRPTPEGIQSVFFNERDQQLAFYVDHHPRGRARCHIYSLPYLLNDLESITSNFPGGVFPLVHQVSVSDIHFSLEHEFFFRLNLSFPFLTNLNVFGCKAQQNKRTEQSNETNELPSIIHFPHLFHLGICWNLIDYSEQFLLDTKAYLPRLTLLTINYEHLEIVTQNFTRQATRRNCANIKQIFCKKSMAHFEHFYRYFPLHK